MVLEMDQNSFCGKKAQRDPEILMHLSQETEEKVALWELIRV
jgi:hypothetical protein